jgi:hypothetical protein
MHVVTRLKRVIPSCPAAQNTQLYMITEQTNLNEDISNIRKKHKINNSQVVISDVTCAPLRVTNQYHLNLTAFDRPIRRQLVPVPTAPPASNVQHGQ